MKKIFKILLFLSIAFFSSVLMVCIAGYLYLSPSLPSIDVLKNVHFQTPLRIMTKDDKLIAEFGEKKRVPISIHDIPEDFIKTILAAEDDRFLHHYGVDILGLLRASLELIKNGYIKSGGSTITMQVAKNFFLSHERVFSRKFNEILLALKIENQLSKSEILELYLNKIYLGQRAYGIEAAAQVYYNKSVQKLSLAQMAMIAGLPKAPSKYNPINDPERAKIRRDWILSRMLNLHYINKAQYILAKEEPVTAELHHSNIELYAPYVAEMIRQEMYEKHGSSIYTDGYTVHTTIDTKLQEKANQSIANGLFRYTEAHGYKGSIKNVSLKDGDDITSWREVLKKIKHDHLLIPAIVCNIGGENAEIFIKDIGIESLAWSDVQWAKPYIDLNRVGATPKSINDVLKIGDVIYVRRMQDGRYRLSQLPQAQSALVSLNPMDGAILALVGGFDFYDNMYNRATQSLRQAGSAFKPFIYSAALENGFTTATLVNDAPIVFRNEELEHVWRPKNANSKFNGLTRFRVGFYNSRNLISIRVLQKIGLPAAISFLKKIGFPEEALQKNLSLALGNVAVSPLKMTEEYAIIANGGYEIYSYLIDRIEQHNNLIYQSEPVKAFVGSDYQEVDPIFRAKRVMDPRVNYIINDMMRDVIKKGSGRRALALKRGDIAGKTGTTNKGKDTWFIGFNRNILTSVWVGMDDNSSLGRWAYGANVALPIWIEYMSSALKSMPYYELNKPEGIVVAKIDKKSGLLANKKSKQTKFEIFRQEYVPKKQENDSNSSTRIRTEDIF